MKNSQGELSIEKFLTKNEEAFFDKVKEDRHSSAASLRSQCDLYHHSNLSKSSLHSMRPDCKYPPLLIVPLCVIVMTFWYIFGMDLIFFKLYFHLGLITTPHVHMTYVYSFSHVSFFTQSYGQEKSLSYYDLFDFGVLFYGHIPTFISFLLLNHPSPILALQVLIIRADLKKGMRRP